MPLNALNGLCDSSSRFVAKHVWLRCGMCTGWVGAAMGAATVGAAVGAAALAHAAPAGPRQRGMCSGRGGAGLGAATVPVPATVVPVVVVVVAVVTVVATAEARKQDRLATGPTEPPRLETAPAGRAGGTAAVLSAYKLAAAASDDVVGANALMSRRSRPGPGPGDAKAAGDCSPGTVLVVAGLSASGGGVAPNIAW